MANLNTEQARAVQHVYGPCLVLAGPGSGKTHTLVERIKYLIEEKHISPKEILVITFSKKAANEMQERFKRQTGNNYYPVYFGTFHAVFYNILKANGICENDSILSDAEKLKYIEKIMRELTPPDSCADMTAYTVLNEVTKMKLYNFTERMNKQMISKRLVQGPYQAYEIKELSQNNNNINIEGYKENNNKAKDYISDDTGFDKKEKYIEEVYIKYMERCRKLNRIDFDDMLYLCRDYLNKNMHMRLKYQKMFRFIFVDEFQDINEVQYDVLNMLSGSERNIFAVGDDDQAIYGFRGSKPELMQRFIDENDNCSVINLKKNYRCAECIIDAAFRLISNNKSRIAKNQEACKANKDDGYVIIENRTNEMTEAEFVCEKIKELRMNENYTEDIAVIYRTAKCANLIEEKLRNAGINVVSRSASENYYETDWIKDIVSYLKIAAGKAEKTDIYRVLNRPERGIARDDNKYIKAFTDEIQRIKNMSPFAAVMYILKVVRYEKYLRITELNKNTGVEEIDEMIDKLLERARNYSSIKEWLDYIEYKDSGTCEKKDARNNEYVQSEQADKGMSVNMLTAHASKGLEFDTVFIVGLQEGIFPHRNAETEEMLEEERRLMYVAMTRAKRFLYIVGRGEEKHGKRISGFIYELLK